MTNKRHKIATYLAVGVLTGFQDDAGSDKQMQVDGWMEPGSEQVFFEGVHMEREWIRTMLTRQKNNSYCMVSLIVYHCVEAVERVGGRGRGGALMSWLTCRWRGDQCIFHSSILPQTNNTQLCFNSLYMYVCVYIYIYILYIATLVI